jgi:putative Ca2+/H+ antiporter (TMEM165/GDT1 family)
VVALAVEYNAPLLIFTGMVLAFALLMGAGVLVGCKLIKLIPKKSLRIFTGAIFWRLG